MKDKRAFALITVLLAIAVLTMLVVELQYSSSVNAKIAGHARDKAKGLFLAESGYRLSLLRLQADSQMDRFVNQGALDHLQEVIWSVPLILPMPKEMLEKQVEEGNMTRDMADQFSKVEDLGGQISAQIEDESAKININDLRHYQSRTTNFTFKIFEALLYQEEFSPYFEHLDRAEFIDNLVDWIDRDDTLAAYGSGVEDLAYSSMNPPYHVKNMPFFSIGEIKLVKDVPGRLIRKLMPYITVYPYNIKLPTQETGKINVNTAPAPVLASLLSLRTQTPKQNLETAKRIIEYREKYGPFKNGKDFADKLEKYLGVPSSALDMRSAVSKLTGSSNVFRIISSGIVNDVTTTIEAVVTRNRSKGTFNLYYYQVR